MKYKCITMKSHVYKAHIIAEYTRDKYRLFKVGHKQFYVLSDAVDYIRHKAYKGD